MREYPGPIIRDGVKDPCLTYRTLVDNPKRAADHELAERLWSIYWPYADPEFYNDLPRDFAARFWEMDLACELLGMKFVLQERRSHGPDICVALADRRLWIEAVAPTDGDGPNASADLRYYEVQRCEPVPKTLPVSEFFGEDGIILRLRNAIEVKFQKYQAYVADGIVDPSDCFVIAVNGARVSAAILEEDPPWIVRSVYPFGATRLRIDVQTEAVTLEHEYRPAVQTAARADVATDVFLRPEYAGISGVLYSRADVLNRGRDLVFVHNHGATNRLERGRLRLGTEYWVHDGTLHVTRFSLEAEAEDRP